MNGKYIAMLLMKKSLGVFGVGILWDQVEIQSKIKTNSSRKY
jgi:hypothetical protein